MKKFKDIYPTYASFLSDYIIYTVSSALTPPTPPVELPAIYNVLLLHFAFQTIGYKDPLAFKFGFWTAFNVSIQTYLNDLRVQKHLSEMSIEDMLDNGRVITNQAQNPDTEPATDSFDALPYVTAQTQQKYQSGALKAIPNYIPLVTSVHTKQFISEFELLFKQIFSSRSATYYNVEE